MATATSSGSGPAVPFFTQPGFSKNIQTTYGGLGSNQYGSIVHGFMEWDTAPQGYGSLAAVQFQFNPSTLAASYYAQPNSQGVTDYIFSSPSNAATPASMMQQSISFSLLFDRTYELWGAYDSAGEPFVNNDNTTNFTDAAALGVGVDIAAMQQITGMFMINATGVGNANIYPATGTASGAGAGLWYQAPLQLIPIWIYFGDSPSSLFYFGYITDWSVQVTQWTQYMVPMRCVIDVDFTLLPTWASQNGSTGGPAGAAGGAWWALNPLQSASATTGGPGSTGVGAQAATVTNTAGGIRG